MKKRMMKLDEVIRKFIEDQSYVRKKLQDEYSIPESITALKWSLDHHKIVEMSRNKPIAKEFRPHGYGLLFEDDKVNIDFDFCETGRPGGFDAWRLFVFCKNNLIKTGLEEEAQFKIALEKLRKEGVIEREKNLYFEKTKGRESWWAFWKRN